MKGRDAVEKEARRERALLEARAAESRLSLAEKAQKRRSVEGGGRNPLPTRSDVTLPWLFDQVANRLDKQQIHVDGGEKVESGHLLHFEHSMEAKLDDSRKSVVDFTEEEVKKGAWWKKLPKRRHAPSESSDCQKQSGNTGKYIFTVGTDKDDEIDFAGKSTSKLLEDVDNFDVDSSSEGYKESNNESESFQNRVYRHRFSKERVHDPNSKIYSDLDEAATIMELREAISENEMRKLSHPKRDNTTKRIIPEAFEVGSDERMYAYHYWGDRSIAISSPSGHMKSRIRDDVEQHLRERTNRRDDLVEDIKELESDLVLSKNTATNIEKRWNERRKWLDQELEFTSKSRQTRDSLLKELEKQKFETKKELFKFVQAGVLLRRDVARFHADSMCHRCLRACCQRCCKTGTDCFGKVDVENPDRKGCCFHCCSTCLCYGCINKFDVDTHIAMLRAKRHIYKGCPCHCCCCCCKCTGRKQFPYKKPEYLDYEDNVWKAYQKKVVEWEVERKVGKPKLDEEGGDSDSKKRRRGKRKKRNTEKKDPGIDGEDEQGEVASIEIGQGK